MISIWKARASEGHAWAIEKLKLHGLSIPIPETETEPEDCTPHQSRTHSDKLRVHLFLDRSLLEKIKANHLNASSLINDLLSKYFKVKE